MWKPPSSNKILVRGYTIGWGKGIPDEYTKVVDNKQRYFVIEDLSKWSVVHYFRYTCCENAAQSIAITMSDEGWQCDV